jgi:hypothetical protein
MITVKDAKYINDYIIEVNFNDNKKGIVDLFDVINDKKIKPFQKLKDKNRFKNFKVDYTIKWDNDLDIAPEYLYFKAFENDASLKEKFQQWGYI